MSLCNTAWNNKREISWVISWVTHLKISLWRYLEWNKYIYTYELNTEILKKAIKFEGKKRRKLGGAETPWLKFLTSEILKTMKIFIIRVLHY